MDDKTIEARRAYKREWNRKNPDKVKAAQERFYKKWAAAMEQKDKDAEQPENSEQSDEQSDE